MRPDELRIGDREREAAVSALGEHYVAGRLTKEEYDERSAVAWQAKNNRDLAPLFVDLPSLQQPGRAPAVRGGSAPPTWNPQPPASRTPPRGFRFPLLPVFLVIIGLAMLTDGWPVLILLGVFWWLVIFRWIGRVRHHARYSRGPQGWGR
jgi:hypothetical protein